MYSNILKWLRFFVLHNKQHQMVVHDEIDLFFTNLDLDLGQIDLICAVFKDNFELLTNIKERYLKKFIHCIKNYGCQPKFLNFFREIQTCNNEYILDNQAKTIDHLYLFPLFESVESLSQILYCRAREREGLVFNLSRATSRSENEEKNIKSNLPFNLYGDVPLDYHLKLLKLLILTQSGSEGHNLNNARIKKIFSLKFLLEILVGKDELFIPEENQLAKKKLKKVFSLFVDSQAVSESQKPGFLDYQAKEYTKLKPVVLEFINEIYLKNSEKNIHQFKPLIEFLENFISIEYDRLQVLEKKIFNNNEFFSFYFDKVLVFFNKYIKFFMTNDLLMETNASNRRDNEMLYLIAEILERNLLNLSGKLTKNQKENLAVYLAHYFTITEDIDKNLEKSLKKMEDGEEKKRLKIMN